MYKNSFRSNVYAFTQSSLFQVTPLFHSEFAFPRSFSRTSGIIHLVIPRHIHPLRPTFHLRVRSTNLLEYHSFNWQYNSISKGWILNTCAIFCREYNVNNAGGMDPWLSNSTSSGPGVTICMSIGMPAWLKPLQRSKVGGLVWLSFSCLKSEVTPLKHKVYLFPFARSGSIWGLQWEWVSGLLGLLSCSPSQTSALRSKKHFQNCSTA